MSDVSALERWRRIVLKLFPWMSRFSLTPSGVLAIKSFISRIEIEGPGPAASRVGDHANCGTLEFDNVTMPAPGIVITYNPPFGVPTVVFLQGAVTVSPSPATIALVAKITTGSEKVKIG